MIRGSGLLHVSTGVMTNRPLGSRPTKEPHGEFSFVIASDNFNKLISGLGN